MLRHLSRAGHLVELWNESLKHLVRARHGVRITESLLLSQVAERLITECIRERLRLPEVPRFQFLARDANQRIGLVSRFAEPAQGFFPRTAVPSVVVPNNCEPHTGLPPAELAQDATLQVALTFVRYTLEQQARKQTRQQAVEEDPHRFLLEEQDESVHSGSTPSKSRCFQSAPGGSPSSYRSRSSLLSDARRTVANPSFLTNQ